MNKHILLIMHLIAVASVEKKNKTHIHQTSEMFCDSPYSKTNNRTATILTEIHRSMYDSAVMRDSAVMCDSAVVHDSALMCDSAAMCDSAVVRDSAVMYVNC